MHELFWGSHQTGVRFTDAKGARISNALSNKKKIHAGWLISKITTVVSNHFKDASAFQISQEAWHGISPDICITNHLYKASQASKFKSNSTLAKAMITKVFYIFNVLNQSENQ
jgi:hypothetical protein